MKRKKPTSPFALLWTCFIAGCTAAPQVDSSPIGRSQAALSSAADVPLVIPAMEWLANLPADKNGERALAEFFARGTATYVPTGNGTGYPVLFHSVPELDWLGAQLWGGKTLHVIPGASYPNGDPVVRLDNKIIKTPDGAVFNLFDALVTRSTVSALDVGTNSRGEKVLPPSGTLAPVPVSFLKDSVAIDGNPSVLLNYFDDQSLPVIRRILDEIREIDGANCKGLFLGRAHARRCVSLSCGEAASPIVDFPKTLSLETQYEWGFWTYFILNFGQQSCDLGPALDGIKKQLVADGLDVSELPAAPPATQP
jgi:hypothetical protein